MALAAFCLRNLVSTDIEPCVPWTFQGPDIPANVRGKDGKGERDKWINDPTTEHQVYSMVEGLNACLRISKDDVDREGNPPFKLHGLVADVDAPMSEEELALALARLPHLPAYVERTLSGNVRLVWPLSAAVSVPSREFLVSVLKLSLKALKLDLLGGLDKPAYLDPARYYTNSGEWQQVSENRIPAELVQGWVVEVAKKHRWKDEGGLEIPLPAVWAEVQKKWPLNGWPGPFELESQGPTFWVPESASPKSAIVKSTGLYTFSQHAHKPFFAWADLLGAQFCEEYKTKNLGKAVEGIYHDGQKYFLKDGTGSWRAFSKEDTASHLQITRHLSAERYKGAPSEVDEALEFIRHWQPIDGAAPCAFQSFGVFSAAGPRILNTHTRKVLEPADESTPWGPEGKFSWLAAYFDYLFDPVEQKDYFLAWLKRFYSSAFVRELIRGQNVFLVGPQGTGKTLLSQNILTKLMGGSAEAQSYLLGETGFNAQLFEVALWTVDDNSSTVSPQKHAMFSSAVKKLSANQLFEYNAKFRTAATIKWQGRAFVTANDDEESLRIIPDLEISALDKTMLFRTTRVAYNFPPDEEIEAILRREMPFFARWLLDWVPPEHTKGTNRFGVAHYHEKSLLRQAEHSSRSNAFSEILEDWADQWFDEHPTMQHWEGTAFQLLKAFSQEEDRRAATKNLNVDTVSRQLSALKGKGHKIASEERRGARVWTIQKGFKV
jgi:hypothetical protein